MTSQARVTDTKEQARKARVLVVDDSEGTRNLCSQIMGDAGYAAAVAYDGQHAIEMLEAEQFDLILTDLMMPRVDGMELLNWVAARHLSCPVILMTAYASVPTAVAAMRQGAYDYVAKPFTAGELKIVVDRALEHRRLETENQELKRELKTKFRFDNVVGTSRAMRNIYKVIEKASASVSNAVIYGESGTGKELIARAIHFNSARAAGQFVAISCSAIPETLLESELFGFRRGAFTGANYDKKGLFEQANGGTLFLDEIGDISGAIQVKLLRVLQERTITPIGAVEPQKVDIRVIAATNRDLAMEVQKKSFREDLFYRLHVIPIYLPPLRDRKSDVPLLAEHFLHKYAAENGKKIKEFGREVMEQFRSYAWPGNVRELENVVQRAVTFAEGDAILMEDLPANFQQRFQCDEAFFTGQIQSLADLISQVEKRHVERALRDCNGRRTETARMLGIDRRTLYDKIKKHHLDEEPART